MNEDARQEADDILPLYSSSDSDSVDYPESYEDSDDISIFTDSTERIIQFANGASAALSGLSRQTTEEINLSGQIYYTFARALLPSDISDDSDSDDISTDTEPSVVTPIETEQPMEVASDTEPSVVQPEEVTSETEPIVVQPEEVTSETEAAVVQPGEVTSATEPAVVQPEEVTLETEPADVQPEEVISATESVVQQPREIASDVIPSPKRRRVISPVKESAEKAKPAKVTADDEDCCPICFESWTTSGNHRTASLKCGHLFGFMCIDKWLKGRGEKCPQCNAKAKRQDIRIIFTRNIKAVDTVERDRALEQLAKVQKRNSELMVETAHLGLKYQVVMSECNRLQTELSKAKEEILVLKCKLNSNNTSSSSSSQFPSTQDIDGMTNGISNVNNQQMDQGKFVWEKTITISEWGNCRVMTYSMFLGTIAVSQPSSVPLFPGFGVKKISSLDFKTTEYMTLHSKPIRNMCFHPTYNDGVLLSCSLDKTVKLTSMISNTSVQVYNLPMGAWSCVWNTDDYNYFYVGLQNGLVQEYDVRNTDSCVRELNREGSHSPVVSLQYVPACPNAHFRPGGILVGQLNQVSFYEKIPGNDYKTHLLPLEGNISSLYFDSNTRQMLASFRSSSSHPKVRHIVCELGMVDETSSVCGCNPIQTFYGGSTQTVLSRSLLVPHPHNKDHLLVCAGDEASRGVKIWNGNSFRFTQDIPCEGSVVDLCSIKINQRHFLMALTDKRLKLLEWKE